MKRLLVGALVGVVALGATLPAAASTPSGLAKKALRIATAANRKAGQALTAAKAGAITVEVQSGDVPAAPNDFAHFDVKCPSGFTATGFSPGLGALELVAALSTGDGYIGSYYNPSDSTVFKGSLDVTCVRGEQKVLSKPQLSRRAATDRLHPLERAHATR